MLELYVRRMGAGQVQEFCQADVFSASCPDGHVIVMQSAFYGRMRLGRCVRGDYGYLGCASDQLDFMDSRCSGADSCRFRVFDSGLGRNSRCPADIASYLEASYYCHRGMFSRSSRGSRGRGTRFFVKDLPPPLSPVKFLVNGMKI